MRKAHTYSRLSLDVARLLGSRVRAGRLARRWTQAELAERIGASVETIAKVERGDPTVALGIALESAHLVGVPLFAEDEARISLDAELVNGRLALLPSRARTRRVHDDF